MLEQFVPSCFARFHYCCQLAYYFTRKKTMKFERNFRSNSSRKTRNLNCKISPRVVCMQCMYRGGERPCSGRPKICKKTRSCVTWNVNRWNRLYGRPNRHCHFHQKGFFLLRLRILRGVLYIQKVRRLQRILFRSEEQYQLLLFEFSHSFLLRLRILGEVLYIQKVRRLLWILLRSDQ